MGDLSAKRVEFQPAHIGTLLIRPQWPIHIKLLSFAENSEVGTSFLISSLRGIVPENNIL